jgi:hypothetical protein
VFFVIRFWEPYADTGYTILIHGLIHRQEYIRITILCYANIVMTISILTLILTLIIDMVYFMRMIQYDHLSTKLRMENSHYIIYALLYLWRASEPPRILKHFFSWVGVYVSNSPGLSGAWLKWHLWRHGTKAILGVLI